MVRDVLNIQGINRLILMLAIFIEFISFITTLKGNQLDNFAIILWMKLVNSLKWVI